MASHTTHAFLEGLRPTLHIAHRGGATLAPENTVAAFDAAVGRWRTEMLEIDVRPTADGEIVVFHDDVLDRCTDGTGPVEALTWSELQTLDAGHAHPDFRGQGVRVPRLDEVLDRFPTLRFNIAAGQPAQVAPVQLPQLAHVKKSLHAARAADKVVENIKETVNGQSHDEGGDEEAADDDERFTPWQQRPPSVCV